MTDLGVQAAVRDTIRQGIPELTEEEYEAELAAEGATRERLERELETLEVENRSAREAAK